MNDAERLHAALGVLPLVAILRGIWPQEAEAIGEVLFASGWRVIEVPLNSPRPLESIETISRRFPQAVTGAGTVLNAAQVREVHAAGARLVVAPNFDREVADEAARLHMAYVPGVATPSEAFAAIKRQAAALKLFPAEMIPPDAVKAMRAVLAQEVRLLPVGGITQASMAAYRAAGASGFGIGSALFKPGDRADAVRQRALEFAQVWRAGQQ